jgi:hypothetical protein
MTSSAVYRSCCIVRRVKKMRLREGKGRITSRWILEFEYRGINEIPLAQDRVQ